MQKILQPPWTSLQPDFEESFLRLIFRMRRDGPYSLNCMCIQLETSLSSVQPENNIYDSKITVRLN